MIAIGTLKNLINKRFGTLTVIKRNGIARNGSAVWLCKCDCGNYSEVRSCSLRSGHTRSCGRCPVNSYSIQGHIAVGKIESGKQFTFDAELLELVKKYSWHIDERNCVKTTTINGETLRLHTLIMGKKKDFQIDHKNNDPSDNRKENLRVVNQQQNIFNNSIRADNSTGFKGACLNRRAKKYQATIVLDGKQNYLGLFRTAKEAAKTYNQKAIELFGEYAFLNSI